MEFEPNILVKKNAPDLLEEALLSKNGRPSALCFQGNTDCYQRQKGSWKSRASCLQVFLKFRHPVGIITKTVCRKGFGYSY